MKITFAILSLFFVSLVSAQFNGKLIYQTDQQVTRFVVTYYQSGNAGRLEAYNIKLKNGIPDSSSLRAQDTILFDFKEKTETRLQHSTGMAYKTQYIATMAAAAMAAKTKSIGSTTVTTKGQETLNGFHCTHFVVTSNSQLGTGMRDIWVSGDVGPSPTVWIAGSYLYFTPGYPHLEQLIAAGASGVIVRAVNTFTHQAPQYTMDLVLADTKHTPPASLFAVPSRYNLIDETGMSFPTKKGD
jgi:hypothetical protein